MAIKPSRASIRLVGSVDFTRLASRFLVHVGSELQGQNWDVLEEDYFSVTIDGEDFRAHIDEMMPSAGIAFCIAPHSRGWIHFTVTHEQKNRWTPGDRVLRNMDDTDIQERELVQLIA